MMDGVDINGIDETGATPLSWAAMIGHEAVMKLLLDAKTSTSIGHSTAA